MRVALPKAEPVSASLRAQFDPVAVNAAATLDLVGAAAAARFE
jgi:hypothetical protein